MKKTTIIAIAFAVIIVLAAVAYNRGWLAPSSAASPELIPALIITYADGSTNVFYPTKLQPIPMVIYDPSAGKVVKQIRLELYATVSYTGQALSWSISGQATWKIQTSTGSDLYSTSMSLTGSGSSAPPNGQAFVVTSATSDASAIESLYTGWTSGTSYRLYVKVDSFTFTITFIDTTQSKSPSTLPSATWNFVYYAPGQISSVSVSWNWVPIYA
jgi:hypothetical protein